MVNVDDSTAVEMIHSTNLIENSIDRFLVWGTPPKQDAHEIKNITWETSVHPRFSYLVRIYYCEFGLMMAETRHVMFKVFINENMLKPTTRQSIGGTILW